jgi:hypothetical protein
MMAAHPQNGHGFNWGCGSVIVVAPANSVKWLSASAAATPEIEDAIQFHQPLLWRHRL